MVVVVVGCCLFSVRGACLVMVGCLLLVASVVCCL